MLEVGLVPQDGRRLVRVRRGGLRSREWGSEPGLLFVTISRATATSELIGKTFAAEEAEASSLRVWPQVPSPS